MVRSDLGRFLPRQFSGGAACDAANPQRFTA